MRYVRGIGIKGFASRQVRSLFTSNVVAGAEGASRLLIFPPRSVLYPLNVAFLRRQLDDLTDNTPAEWTFWTRFPSPELVQATNGMPFAATIYEPIDRYDTSLDFTRAQRQRIAQAEARLVSRATVIAGGAGIARRLSGAVGGSNWIPFGRDLAAGAVDQARRPKIDAKQKRIGVVAELDWRVDAELIARIAAARPAWKIVLVGPRAKRWGTELAGLRNIEFVGRVEPSAVPEQLRSFDVSLIPYVLNDWTRACLPVKVYEYLAEGRPVVATPLPELKPFSDVIYTAGAEAFVDTIERAMRLDSEAAREARIKASMRFTLQDRARRAIALLEGKSLMVPAV